MKCLKLLDSIKDTQVSYPLLSMTYSNFSALYKETGKLKESNKFLLKVIEIEKKFPANKYNSINAYLSLCSNFSLLNEHEIALRNGLTGLMLLQKEFPLPEILVSTTVIAYHNVGVEYEYLSRIQEAVDSYYKGWTLAKSRLGLTHSLTLSIKNSFLASSNSNKLPGVTVRTNSQYAYKRADLAEQSIHTGSTSSSGATETRNILTPRLGGNKRRIARGFDKFKPKIDLITQRNNEKNAAVTIQAWWRGIRQRRIFKKVKMKFQLKKAAVKAQAAYQEFKMLKEQFSKKNIRMSLDEIQNFSKRVKSKSINPPGGHARAKFKNVNKSDDFPQTPCLKKSSK
jgi:tetratricopeptide (TPR) repeat protein